MSMTSDSGSLNSRYRGHCTHTVRGICCARPSRCSTRPPVHTPAPDPELDTWVRWRAPCSALPADHSDVTLREGQGSRGGKRLLPVLSCQRHGWARPESRGASRQRTRCRWLSPTALGTRHTHGLSPSSRSRTRLPARSTGSTPCFSARCATRGPVAPRCEVRRPVPSEPRRPRDGAPLHQDRLTKLF